MVLELEEQKLSMEHEKIKPTDLMKLYDMLEQDTQIKRLVKNNGERTLKPLSKKTILEHNRLNKCNAIQSCILATYTL